METKRLIRESYYQRNFERLLRLEPVDCQKRVKTFKECNTKDSNRKLVTFYNFLDSTHETQLELHQSQIQLDKKNF